MNGTSNGRIGGAFIVYRDSKINEIIRCNDQNETKPTLNLERYAIK